ncbi:hypothetical protein ACVWZD_006684 [Streptomyces sp. TE3672]
MACWARSAGLTTEGHTTDWDTCGPDCPTDAPEHRMRRKDRTTFYRNAACRLNRQMIDRGADLVIAVTTPNRRFATDLRYAHAAQIPVREVHAPDASSKSTS